ncbi:hypothetical protein C9374_000391, partial [Naegleria lovaniensis]
MEKSRAVPGMALSGEETDMATNEIIFDPAFKSSSCEEDIFLSTRNKSNNNKMDTCIYNMYDEPITPNKRHVVQDDDFFAVPKQEEQSIEKEDHTSKPSRNRSSSTLSNTSSCSNISNDGMRPTAIIEFIRCSSTPSMTTIDTTSIPRSESFPTSIMTSEEDPFSFNPNNVSGLQGDDIFDLPVGIPSESSVLMDDEGIQSDSIFDFPNSPSQRSVKSISVSSPIMAHEDKNTTPKKASDTTKSKKPKKDKKKHMVGNLLLNLTAQNEEEKPTLVKAEKDVRESVRNIVQPKITESGSFMLSDRYKANQDGTQRNEISPESAQPTIDSAQSFINAFNILSLNSNKGPLNPLPHRQNQPSNNSDQSEAQRLRQALSGNSSVAPPAMATVNSFKMSVNSAVLSTSKGIKTEKKKRTLKRFNNEDFT